MSEGSRVLIRNPNSGDGQAARRAAALGRDRGFAVRDSEGGDHAIELAAEAVREAADAGGGQVAACGGDGTLNKVIRGALRAGDGEAIPDGVTLGVVPAGTGNDFADNIGVRGVEHAFRVLDEGDRRALDLGLVGDRPFVNSCVGGLTADASARTSRAAKRRLGVLAYVLSTLREYPEFEPLKMTLRAGEDPEAPTWTGDALVVLVGNGRRFPGERMQQANMEDGLLNVVVIREAPPLDYLATGAADRLLRRDASHVTRLKVPRLTVDCHRPVEFSLDGEMVDHDRLRARSLPGALPFRVGASYDPEPEEWSRRLR